MLLLCVCAGPAHVVRRNDITAGCTHGSLCDMLACRLLAMRCALTRHCCTCCLLLLPAAALTCCRCCCLLLLCAGHAWTSEQAMQVPKVSWCYQELVVSSITSAGGMWEAIVQAAPATAGSRNNIKCCCQGVCCAHLPSVAPVIDMTCLSCRPMQGESAMRSAAGSVGQQAVSETSGTGSCVRWQRGVSSSLAPAAVWCDVGSSHPVVTTAAGLNCKQH